ncbi:MAG: hypothetical protein HQM09_07065 [Candidatus Riflebacteria bacterium]|nr:hypothetical protein [Candidatus Riflebacteria bacterium]
MNMSDSGLEQKSSAGKLIDFLALAGFVATILASYLIATNKAPRTIKWLYEHFYLFAVVGTIGFLGERISVALLILLLPTALIGGTYFLTFQPEKYPLEDWFALYSMLVVSAALFSFYLFYRWEQTKKMRAIEGEVPKSRVDPAIVAQYRDEQLREKAAENEKLAGLAPLVSAREGDTKRKLKGAKEEKPLNPNETADQRFRRETDELKELLNQKTMKFSSTLVRMKELSKSLEHSEIYKAIIENIEKGVDGERVQLLLNNEKDSCLRVVEVNKGTPENESRRLKELVIPHEENSMLGYLMTSSKSVAVTSLIGAQDLKLDPKTSGLVDKGLLKSILIAPIYVQKKIFAVINVEKLKKADYTRDDQNLVATCADVAGLVMSNAKLYAATMEDLSSTKKISEEQLRKNEEMKGALSRIVSPRVLEMMLKNPSMMKLGGTKCEVTVFFSDIRGFTRMSEGMDPQVLVEQLNVYFTRMTDILMQMDGTLDKYVGDEMMALFGAPASQPDDPFRAVLCAITMMSALRELQVVWKKEGKPVIEIGIGIHTGIMTAGYMGSEKQLSYTVIGDNVNLGARVMANAKPMEILITRAVFERVKECFETEVLEPIMVKGKSMAIEIFLVKKVKAGVNLETVMSKSTAMGEEVTVGAQSAAAASTVRSQSVLMGLTTEQQSKQNVQIDTKPKVIECANCGTENDMQIKFCSKCGMPIF